MNKLKISFERVELGRVVMITGPTIEQRQQLDRLLRRYELEVMDNPKQILVERIKVVIIAVFHAQNDDVLLKFSAHLSKSLHYDYTYLANVFSEIEGSTIEKFYIQQKIFRVKELIMYENISLKEIAYSLNYSNISHLCKQFKKVTGLTPAGFRKQWGAETEKRKSTGLLNKRRSLAESYGEKAAFSI